jgi:hypothetical protein
MTPKVSLVLAAFAAGIAAQPLQASDDTVSGGASDNAVLTDFAVIRPSAAAVDKLKNLIEGNRIEVTTITPFVQVHPFVRVVFDQHVVIR